MPYWQSGKQHGTLRSQAVQTNLVRLRCTFLYALKPFEKLNTPYCTRIIESLQILEPYTLDLSQIQQAELALRARKVLLDVLDITTLWDYCGATVNTPAKRDLRHRAVSSLCNLLQNGIIK